jgi:hypothetical protein
MHSPLPARPSKPLDEPPRMCLPAPPTPGRPQSPVSAWSPPPMPAASTMSSPTPNAPRFQATPQWLDFSNGPSPRMVIKPQAPSPRVVIKSRHLSALPPPVLPTRKPISHCTRPGHRPHFCSSQLDSHCTNVLLTTFPLPNLLDPLMNPLVFQGSARPCILQKLMGLHTSAKH